jgi:6-phosphogluconolactonase
METYFHDMELRVIDDTSVLAEEAAHLFFKHGINEFSADGPRNLTFALSGGSTPRALYEYLALPAQADRIPWSHVEWMFGDERFVSQEDIQSNFRMTREALFDKVAAHHPRVYPVPVNSTDPHEVASQYEKTMKQVFRLVDHRAPAFDFMLLGLGPDAHTASLFPGSQAISETKKLVAANYVDKFGTWRITVTPPVIQAAKTILILASGAEKAQAVRDIMMAPLDVAEYPAQILRNHSGRVIWLLDKSAASELTF